MRRLISDMDLPEFEGKCLHGFWTDQPCLQPATHIGTDQRPRRGVPHGSSNQWRCCEKHRTAGDQPMKRPTVLTSTVGQATSEPSPGSGP